MQRTLFWRRVGISVLSAAWFVFGLPLATRADDVTQWTVEAVGSDSTAASRAIDSLRALGPSGLAAFTAAHGQRIAELREKPACLCATDSPQRQLADALDGIAGQRDAAWAGLYWYTDFAAARTAAKRGEKPILSLRLLGKLTDELSCANSRFFRTTLYADPQIAKFLSEHFVLHWQSGRPAPKITVDFGDGRKLERTITGNSVHYVLDSEGRVVDVLPGLYSPQAFLRALDRAQNAAFVSEFARKESRTEFLVDYHRRQEHLLTEEMKNGPEAVHTVTPGATPDSPATRVAGHAVSVTSQPKASQQQTRSTPTASDSTGEFPILVPKGRGEAPLVRTVTPVATPDIPASPAIERAASVAAQPGLSIAALKPLADRLLLEIVLSKESQTLIRAKLAAVPAGYLPGPLDQVQAAALTNLVRGIAFDTARSEYDFHRQIHGWLVQEPNIEREKLNDRIYAELFLMPRSDPWLGLLNIEAFSAINGHGVLVEK